MLMIMKIIQQFSIPKYLSKTNQIKESKRSQLSKPITKINDPYY